MKWCKNVLFLALAMVVCNVPTNVFAENEELVDYTQYGFEDFKNPDDYKDKVFFLDTAFNVDEKTGKWSIDEEYQIDEYWANIAVTGEYKYIQYEITDDKTYLYWQQDEEKVSEDGLKYTDTLTYYDRSKTLDDILASASPASSHSYFIYMNTPESTLDSYMLVFSKDAKSINDLLYVIHDDDFMSHTCSEDEFYHFAQSPTLKLNFKSFVKGDDNSNKGMTFVLDSNMAKASNIVGMTVDENIRYVTYNDHNYTLENNTIILDNVIYDDTDKFTVYTDLGNTYEGTITYPSSEKYGQKSTATDAEVDTIKPEIKISDLPAKESLDYGAKAVIEISSNTKVTLNINGDTLDSGDYVTSATYTVTENGTYHYIATNASGLVTEGDFTIDCFKPENESSLITDDEFVVGSTEFVSSSGEFIAQTGIERNNTLILIGTVLVLISAGAIGVVILKKKGVLNYDKKEK